MELHELHVDEVGARVVGQRVSVARVLPAVARYAERLPDATRRQDDRFGPPQAKAPALAVVA
jgi:hypothetical protein